MNQFEFETSMIAKLGLLLTPILVALAVCASILGHYWHKQAGTWVLPHLVKLKDRVPLRSYLGGMLVAYPCL